jgi:hypothetical protein
MRRHAQGKLLTCSKSNAEPAATRSLIKLIRGNMKKQTVAFRWMAFAVLTFVFGGGPFALPATAADACPAGYFQNGVEKFDVHKPHCIAYRSTRDKLLLDKVAHQESAKPERKQTYNYCLLLHPGGEDC